MAISLTALGFVLVSSVELVSDTCDPVSFVFGWVPTLVTFGYQSGSSLVRRFYSSLTSEVGPETAWPGCIATSDPIAPLVLLGPESPTYGDFVDVF